MLPGAFAKETALDPSTNPGGIRDSEPEHEIFVPAQAFDDKAVIYCGFDGIPV